MEIDEEYLKQYIEKVQVFTMGLENCIVEHEENLFLYAWNKLKSQASYSITSESN